jgi:hypothetical protein
MMKKLLTISFVALTILIVSNVVNAQKLYFCTDVDNDGYAIDPATSFTIRNEGDYIKFLVRSPYEINCREVRYVIYRNGDYDNTIYQSVERSWVWWWKKIEFYKSGTFDIYVYDSYDVLLCSGTVRISWR